MKKIKLFGKKNLSQDKSTELSDFNLFFFVKDVRLRKNDKQ